MSQFGSVLVSANTANPFALNLRGLPEETIKGAFIDAYNIIVGDKSDLITDFVTIFENALSKSDVSSRVKDNEKLLAENKKQQDCLAGLYAKGSFKERAYQKQFSDLAFQEDKLKKENTELGYQSGSETTTIESLQRFKEAVELSGKKPISEFSESIFGAYIQKVMVGGYDDANKSDPYKLTFIFKSGFKSIIEQDKTYKDGKHPVVLLKDAKGEERKTIKVTTIKHFWRHTTFVPYGTYGRKKTIDDLIQIDVAMEK